MDPEETPEDFLERVRGGLDADAFGLRAAWEGRGGAPAIDALRRMQRPDAPSPQPREPAALTGLAVPSSSEQTLRERGARMPSVAELLGGEPARPRALAASPAAPVAPAPFPTPTPSPAPTPSAPALNALLRQLAQPSDGERALADRGALRQGSSAELMGQVRGQASPAYAMEPLQLPAELEADLDEALRVGQAYRARQSGADAAPTQTTASPPAMRESPVQVPEVSPAPPLAAPPTVADLSSPPSRAASQRPAQAASATVPTQAAASSPRGAGEPQRAPMSAERQALMAALEERLARAQAPVDYTAADWSDAIRRPLHLIGSALAGGLGTSSPAFRSERDALDARRERERATAIEQLGALSRLDALEREQRDEESDALRRRALDAERLGLERASAEREAAQEEQAAEVRALEQRLLRQRIERGDAEERTRAAELDPGSADSQRERDLFLEMVRLAEPLGYELPDGAVERLGNMNAGQIRAEREYFAEQILRPSTHRRGRGATALPRAAPSPAGRAAGSRTSQTAPRETPTDPVLALAESAGMSPASIAAYDASSARDRERLRRRAEELLDRQGAAQRRGDAEGTEILPGVRSSMRLSDTAAERLRDAVSETERRSRTLAQLEDIARRYGGLRARISPEAAAEVRPALLAARGMAAAIQGSGVINPSEVPTINAALPNPQDLTAMTFGQFNQSLRSWRRLLQSSIVSQLRSRGVDDVGIDRVLRQSGLPALAGAGRASIPSGDTVRVIAPDGRVGRIPRAQLERARAAGFREAPNGP